MQKKRYILFQGIEKLNEKHKKISEQKKGLLDERYYTEGEMLATMLDLAEKDTFFTCSCIGFDTLETIENFSGYTFTMRCNDYFVNDRLDTKKLQEDFYKKRGA